MKKLLCLSVLLSTTVHGSSFTGPENLKGVTVCFSSTTVSVDDNATKISASVKSTIYDAVRTKLRAYRVPFAEDCLLSSVDLSIQVDSITTASDLNVYYVSFEVFNWGLQKKGAMIYRMGTFGTTVDTGSSFNTRLSTIVGTMVDRFAADYATANP